MEENSNDSLKESFEKELKNVESETIMSPEYRKKKLTMWAIRTVIAIGLYFYFWEYEWVRWSLWFYVPLNLFGLGMLFATPYFLKKKIERTRAKIESIDEIENE